MHKIARLADRDYVAEQYRQPENLNARILLHQHFSINQYGWQRWVFDQLRFPARGRILELGCGPGDLWLENEDRIPEGWEVILSDLSAGMVHRARQNLGHSRHPFQFHILDAQSIPAADQSLDGVLANHMLYHVPDLPRVLAEVRRVLKPEGRLYASTVGRNHLREIRDLVTRFDARLSLWGGHTADSFALESGAAHLKEWFASVSLTRYHDALLVTEPAPLIDYIRSGSVQLLADEAPSFAAFVDQELQQCGGEFHVTKDSGTFEAHGCMPS
jgi:ubiquinone/menaquinone biosynthesis C-methylase UbiE